jgi:lipopolysaccharide transport system permease protein
VSYGPEAAVADWVIEPKGDTVFARIAEVWQYRRLLKYFAGRTLQALYKRSSFGWIWMMVRVCAPIGLNSIIFGGVLDVKSSDGSPYWLFLLCGQTTWILFDRSLLFITRSMERNRKLISKVYFPRLILPIAAVSPSMLFLAILSMVLVGSNIYLRQRLGIWYIPLTPRLLFAPFAVAISLVFAVAVGFWTSVLQVRYRDIRFGIRYAMPLLMYLTSVLWPLSHIKYPVARALVALNPMESAIELFRYGTLGTPLEIGSAVIAGHMVAIAVTAATGIWFFNRVESASVDKI